MKIHYLIHASFEGIGTIATWAENKGHVLSGTHTYRGEKLPEDINSFDFLIVMGGPQSLVELDNYPYIKDEIEFVKKAIKANKLVLGICLGSQIVGEALGAKTTKSPNKEIGEYPITLINDAIYDPVFSKLGQTFNAFHWHSDMPGIPDGATVLAKSDGCPTQAFRHGKLVYAIQFHLELTSSLVDNMIEYAEAEELSPGKYVHSANELRLIDCKPINQKLFILLDQMVSLIGLSTNNC